MFNIELQLFTTIPLCYVIYLYFLLDFFVGLLIDIIIVCVCV